MALSQKAKLSTYFKCSSFSIVNEYIIKGSNSVVFILFSFSIGDSTLKEKNLLS